MVRWARVVAPLLARAAAAASQPSTPEPPIVEPPFAALADDAGRYAAHYGVSLPQAIARLRAQAEVGVLVDRIRALYGSRLAGIAIEHMPGFRVVVLLAGGGAVADETADLAGLAVPVVYRTDAIATIDDIRAAIVDHQVAIRSALADPPGLGVDERIGALVVTVSPRDADAAGPGMLEGRFSALTGVPVEIAVPGAAENLALGGGERLDAADPQAHRRYYCTSGFTVTDGRRLALSTAAHCPDSLDAAGVPLAMIGAWGAGLRDVQIHDSPVPLAPAFRVGTGAVARPVTGVGIRARTVTGEFVCHQGFRAGESCAEVVATDFAPPGDLCAGPCPPDWVAVSGPDCAHGDSGGPVFDVTVALGLFKGASFRGVRCTLYYYMSVDALPAGWAVAVAPLEAPPPVTASPVTAPAVGAR